MKIKYIFQFILLSLLLFFVACNKDKYYEGEKDPKKIKGYKNENYYASGEMDSLQAISHITAQKLQEVYDLAILAAENKSNKDIDTLLLSQLQGYFPQEDTIFVSRIVNGLDSLKVKFVKIELDKKSLENFNALHDSIGTVKYKIQFYDKNKKFFTSQDKKANYILKKNPEKFKSEFKFYFSSIGNAEK